MKRSITMSVGALVLSQFLAFTALAAPKCYTTGPLENEDSQSTTFFVKILNNDKDDDVQANIVAFNLNDQKIIFEEASLEVEPLSSDFTVVGDEENIGPEFEVQVQLVGKALDNALLGGFGKDENGGLVPAHRLVHSEWTKMECKNFGLGSTDTDEGGPEATGEGT